MIFLCMCDNIHTHNMQRKLIEELAKQIRFHQDLYYNHHPQISDKEFDQLWDELKHLNPSHEVFQHVGVDNDDRYQKRPHILHMHSQDKVTHTNEFIRWAQHVRHPIFIVEYKLDGMSLELQYKNGHLQYGLSRGDGKVGDDLTHNVRKLFAARLVLPQLFSGAVRGEVVMLRRVHQTYYKGHASIRNTVNGLMKRKDGCGIEYLRLYSYDAQYTDTSNSFSNELHKLEWLKKMGFLIVEYKVFRTVEKVLQYHQRMIHNRTTLPFDIDGLVVKGIQIDIADTQRTHPEKQVAFKFPPYEAISEICDIHWHASGHRYTPVAHIKPVHLAGTRVKRASLVNPDFISQYNIAIGARIQVSKRGDIIPRIEKVLYLPPLSYVPLPPLFCDTCGSIIHNTGTTVYCANTSCPTRSLHRIRKWIRVLKIPHLGSQRIKELFDTGIVRDIPDLYTLSKKSFENLPRFGTVLKNKILQALQKNKNISFAQFFSGFDIEGIGEIIIGKITQNTEGLKALMTLVRASEKTAKEIDQYLEAQSEATQKLEKGQSEFSKLKAPKELSEALSKFSKIAGIGDTRAQILSKDLIAMRIQMQQLLDTKMIHIIHSFQKSNLLAGKSFCFTGTLNRMTREKAARLVESKGATVYATVRNDLDYLVVGESKMLGAKYKKAQQLQIIQLAEDEFFELIQET